jgi:hypothetical protein
MHRSDPRPPVSLTFVADADGTRERAAPERADSPWIRGFHWLELMQLSHTSYRDDARTCPIETKSRAVAAASWMRVAFRSIDPLSGVGRDWF